MYPELFQIPGTSFTIRTYGLMLAVGFLVGLWTARKLTRKAGLNEAHTTNITLYALISGVIGARLFYVVHYFDRFQDNLWRIIFSRSGLELLGGVLLAALVILMYLRYHRLPARKYLDILAIAVMAGLSFGRIGCFLNGCCYGQPTDVPWAVQFPYGSLVYQSQIYPDPDRGRSEPYINLPKNFFGYYDEQDNWRQGLKPYNMLNEKQKEEITEGKYQPLPVHPTQLYSSLNAAIISLCVYMLIWRRSSGKETGWVKPGYTFAAMFVFYGIGRFTIEFFRGDNPYEFDGLTISQNVSLLMVVAGLLFAVMFRKIKTGKNES